MMRSILQSFVNIRALAALCLTLAVLTAPLATSQSLATATDSGRASINGPQDGHAG